MKLNACALFFTRKAFTQNSRAGCDCD